MTEYVTTYQFPAQRRVFLKHVTQREIIKLTHSIHNFYRHSTEKSIKSLTTEKENLCELVTGTVSGLAFATLFYYHTPGNVTAESRRMKIS